MPSERIVVRLGEADTLLTNIGYSGQWWFSRFIKSAEDTAANLYFDWCHKTDISVSVLGDGTAKDIYCLSVTSDSDATWMIWLMDAIVQEMDYLHSRNTLKDAYCIGRSIEFTNYELPYDCNPDTKVVLDLVFPNIDTSALANVMHQLPVSNRQDTNVKDAL